MTGDSSLDGRVALVTGGTRGLGLAQARALHASGARVVVTGTTPETVETAGAALPDGGARVHDMRDLAATPGLIAEIEQTVGPIACLVNNAGIHLKKPIWDVEDDELRDIVDVNLVGLFALTREVVRRMRDRAGGSIVNISSMAGLMALPSAAGYVATKTAVIGLTRSIAVDGGPYNIRCNAVCPGFIETDMTRKVLAGDLPRAAKIADRIPMTRLGTAEAVAAMVVHLCSDASAYVTGQAIAVDGGFSIGF